MNAQTVFERPSVQNTRASFTGPNGATAFRRIAFIIPQSEITGLIPSSTNLTKLRIPYLLGPADANGNPIITTQNIGVYLMNTTDAVFTSTSLGGTTTSLTWASTAAAMTSVYNGAITIGANAEITFATPFNYTGGGLYVAFDIATTSALATYSASILSNNNLATSLLIAEGATLPASFTNASASRPAVAFGFNGLTNDLRVELLENTSQTPIVGRNTEVVAYVRNRSAATKTNVQVTINVTGANTYTTQQTIPSINSGALGVAVFNAFVPTATGTNNITVSIASDDVTTNNSLSTTMETTCNTYSWTSGSTAASRIGNTTTVGTVTSTVACEYTNQYPVTGQTISIAGVNIGISGDPNNVGKVISGAIYNKAGTLLAQSTAVTLTAADVNTKKYFAFASPVSITDTFYIGASVPANAASFSPIASIPSDIVRMVPGFFRTASFGPNFAGVYFKSFVNMILEAVTTQTAPTVSALVATNPLCNGQLGSIAAPTVTGGTPAYTYKWSNNTTNPSVVGLAAGTYSLSVTGANACMAMVVTATIAAAPSAITVTPIVAMNPSCNGQLGSIAAPTVTGGTGAYTYRWSNNTTNPGAAGLAAGAYSVVVSDANACTVAANTVTIAAAPSAITVTALVGTNPTCSAPLGSIAAPTVTGGTGAYTYRWSNNTTNPGAAGLTAGIYSLVVTDANSCTASPNAITLTLPANAPVISALVPTNPRCNGQLGSIAAPTVTGGTGAYTYRWSNNTTNPSVAGLTAGTYSLSVSDANACTTIANTTIAAAPSAITVTPIVATNPRCNGQLGSIAAPTVTGGTGAYTYRWSNNTTNPSAAGLAAGTYGVTISDANACTTVANTVTIAAAPSAITVTIANGSNTATANVTGGTSGYTYNWTGPVAAGTATNQMVTLTASTAVTVVVTDANGCTSSQTANVVSGVESTNGSTLSVYPNPTTGKVSISLTSANQEAVKMTVFNTVGQVVGVTANKVSANQYELDFSNLDAAVYTVRINVGAEVITRTVILNK